MNNKAASKIAVTSCVRSFPFCSLSLASDPGKLVAVDSNFSAAVAAVRFSAQEVVGDIT
jgi:hypothetical protein